MIGGLSVQGLRVGRGDFTLTVADFTLPPGQRLAVLGANGSGKTTLLKTLAGLLPPLAGAVSVAGHDLAKASDRQRAALCAYAPPPGEVSAPFRVIDMALMPVTLHRRATPADHEAALTALRDMDAEALAERRFDRLSTGERQLVVAARALVQDARLCLFDEPTAALDPLNRDRVETAMAALAAPGRMAVFTSHDLKQLRRADAWLAVSNGHAVLTGADMLDDEERLAGLYGGARPR